MDISCATGSEQEREIIVNTLWIYGKKTGSSLFFFSFYRPSFHNFEDRIARWVEAEGNEREWE